MRRGRTTIWILLFAALGVFLFFSHVLYGQNIVEQKDEASSPKPQEKDKKKGQDIKLKLSQPQPLLSPKA